MSPRRAGVLAAFPLRSSEHSHWRNACHRFLQVPPERWGLLGKSQTRCVGDSSDATKHTVSELSWSFEQTWKGAHSGSITPRAMSWIPIFDYKLSRPQNALGMLLWDIHGYPMRATIEETDDPMILVRSFSALLQKAFPV